MSDVIDQLMQRAVEAKRSQRFADARQDLLQAIGLLRQQPASIELARALRLLGEVERKLHDNAAARRHYEEAVALYREHGDRLALAHTVRHLGDVYQEAKNPELAEPCYREALELYRSCADAPPLDLANAIRSMAVLKGESGETEQARTLWQEARGLYAQVNVAQGVAESSARLARLAE